MAVCSAVVEMLVSMLHHPLGAAVPHEIDEVAGESPLGAVPHQIRGFMAGFRQMLIGGQAFDKCTVRSPLHRFRVYCGDAAALFWKYGCIAMV